MSNNKTSSIEQYIRRLSGQEKESQNVEHNYMKHWTSHPDSHRTKPAKLLFMNFLQKNSQRQIDTDELDDDIDVVTADTTFVSPFDTPESKTIANQVEQSLKINSSTWDIDESEIEKILENCTFPQQRIYDSVIQVLQSDILAKTVYSGQPHEALKKSIATEKHSKELRNIFANNFYDFDLIFWLHKVILENTNFATVVSYLNLLQALRAKVPTLVDKIVKSYSGKLGEEYLSRILKKQLVDPVAPMLNQVRPKKLSNNPFLLISCAGIEYEKAEESSRFCFLRSTLAAFCKTIYIPVVSNGAALTENASKMVDVAVTSLKHKIKQLKNQFPNRPIIVAGWTIGAVIACQVAIEMPVDAVICLGFPLKGVNGSRGDLDDPLLNSTKPTLFIIGQNANMCSIDDIEDFRFRMSGETGLVVIGGADDYLRISAAKMLEENITQFVIDRCIVDEIGDFLQSLTLLKLPSKSTLNSNISTLKHIVAENKEENAVNVQDNRKRRKKRQSKEPDLQSSQKRFRHSVLKEGSYISSKSISNLETSSSGSSKSENPSFIPAAKRKPVKRGMGRPPVSTSERKLPVKPCIKPTIKDVANLTHNAVRKPFQKLSVQKRNYENFIDVMKLNSEISITELLTPPNMSTVKPSESKTSIPFALNILPKKDDPVDVDKAFGKDSSFLPRPLTPSEPEENTSAKEIEQATVESEQCTLLDSKIISISLSEPLKAQKLESTNQLLQTVSTSEKSIMPEETFLPITCLNEASSIIKPIMHSTPNSTKKITVSVTSPSYKTMLQHSKNLNSNSITQLKNLAGVNLISRPQTNTVNTSKPMITVPSNSATILVHGSSMKTQTGKVLKLLSKGPLKYKDPPTISPVSGSASSTINKCSSPITNISTSSVSTPTDPQVCNLSLLSDVAGMTESLKGTRKLIPRSSTATLVKLTVPNKSNPFKHVQSLKPSQSHSTVLASTKVDTPEEMAEKQLAIQALNRSIGIDSSLQPAKESGYSVCFAKPDGSILSRTVSKTSNPTYVRQSLLQQISAKGKTQSVLPKTTFYKK